MPGRKWWVEGLDSKMSMTVCITQVLVINQVVLRARGESGIPVVAGMCGDRRRNISGEGDFLNCH